MSPVVADAAVAIRGDLSKFSSDLNKAEKQTQTLGGKLKNALSPGNLAAGLAGGFAVSQIGQFLGDAIGSASDLAETQSKVKVVFGESAKAIEKMGKTSATALGMSENAALAAAGTYGNLFRAMGITEEVSADMSVGLVGLAADLASFNNMNPTEVLDKLRAGLSGETEPLRTLGVNLNVAAISAKAMEMGLASSAAGLTPAIKAQATYALILEQTSLAQGDFSRTADGMANTQRVLEAEMADLSAEIGQQLLPIMVELMHVARDDLIPAIRSIGGALSDAARGVGRIGAAWATIGMDFGSMGQKLHDVADAVGSDFQTVKDKVYDAMHDSGLSFEEATKKIKQEMLGWPPAVKGAVVAVSRNLGPGGVLDTAVQAGTDAVVADVAEVVPQMADAMLADQQKLKDAAGQLVEFMAQALSPAQERARALAFLASQAYKDGMASGIPAVVTKATELRNEAMGVLTDTGGAWSGGINLANAWKNGLITGLQYAQISMIRQLGILKANLYGNSPPKEGPLKDIDKGGYNVGKAWATSFAEGIGLGKLSLPTLGANGGLPSLPGPAGGGVPSGGITYIYQLSVGGVPYSFDKRDDFIKALDDLSGFGGDGRLG